MQKTVTPGNTVAQSPRPFQNPAAMYPHVSPTFADKLFHLFRSASYLCGIWLSLTITNAQESRAETLETLAMEWITTNKAIGNEETRWQEEKASLQRLIALRRRQTDDFKATFSAHPTDGAPETNSQKLAAAEQQLLLDADKAAGILPEIEKQLGTLRAVLPPPLRDALKVHVNTWQSSGADTITRLRAILAFLRGFEEFQQKITLNEETITLPDGSEYFVQTLYLGTATGYYIDVSGTTAGRGYPGNNGWVWEAAPKHTKAIASAIRSVSQEKKDTPLTNLPAQIRSISTAE